MSLGPLFCGGGLCAWRLVDPQTKALRPSELKAQNSLSRLANSELGLEGHIQIFQFPRAAQGHQSLLSQVGGGQGSVESGASVWGPSFQYPRDP